MLLKINFIQWASSKHRMNPYLSEEDMPRALFGDVDPAPKVAASALQESVPEIGYLKPAAPAAK